ncbi:inorganic phosphate transporter [Duganella violaceipulchra]|uniref:Inorganic phosphate transporter n=1 Tax=Duganella violaceipulchra TaxID=2849652 RepID=A0AA41H5G7_9BURK|nr:inorganic phosphate transporter [Duganella violaceicalia]MBV6322083.1 inorganic phosphate transporter [Duganella violaceicalia]MCP2006919.1 phosphate/sulfate permease [Duganella violaceicalia]
MNTVAQPARISPADSKNTPITALIFVVLLLAGLLFGAYSLRADVTEAGPVATNWLPYMLLGLALLIALGFEFVNGFHDTANAMMHGRDGTGGVDWAQASKVGYSLLLSPMVGFGCAALLLLALRAFVKSRELYEAPVGNTPQPWYIRGLLPLICTGGKSHLTYAQGASAELVAMLTIGATDMYGIPVSTTHVLSSGVAGTMATNRSGRQWSTVRNLAMAWVPTLPVAILLSGSLFWLFSHIF